MLFSKFFARLYANLTTQPFSRAMYMWQSGNPILWRVSHVIPIAVETSRPGKMLFHIDIYISVMWPTDLEEFRLPLK